MPLVSAEWKRYTISAAGGAALTLVAAVVWSMDVRADAKKALDTTTDHEARIRSLERGMADITALKEQMGEVRADVKELIRRTPPR